MIIYKFLTNSVQNFTICNNLTPKNTFYTKTT